MFSLTWTYARIDWNDFCFLQTLMKTILLIMLCVLLLSSFRSCRRAEKNGTRCLLWFEMGKLYVAGLLTCFCMYFWIYIYNFRDSFDKHYLHFFSSVKQIEQTNKKSMLYLWKGWLYLLVDNKLKSFAWKDCNLNYEYILNYL